MLGDIFQWISDHLHAMWPIRIIRAGSQGVLLHRDGSVTRLDPGLHWFKPGLEQIHSVGVLYQEVDCSLQSIETSDKEAVTFSANVGFEVTDAAKAWTAVHHLTATLERAARRYLASLIMNQSFDETHDGLDETCDTARCDLERFTASWGIKIILVGITDFVRTRQYRVFSGEGISPILDSVDLTNTETL